MAIDVVLYAPECEAGSLTGSTPPIFDWLDGLPQRARLPLIARIEMLASRGVRSESPLVISLGERIRAVWCRCNGQRHLVLFSICEGSDRDAERVVLLHGCSVAEPLSTLSDTKHKTRSRRLHLPRQVSAAPAPADDELIDGLAAPIGWRDVVPTREVTTAAQRLAAFERDPVIHTFAS